MNCHYCGEKVKGDWLAHMPWKIPYHTKCFTEMTESGAETPAEEAERVLEELWEENK